MNEVSNFCTGTQCHMRPGAPATPLRAPSRAQLRDDPPWVRRRWLAGWLEPVPGRCWLAERGGPIITRDVACCLCRALHALHAALRNLC